MTDSALVERIGANLAQVEAHIAAACESAGRVRSEVLLLPVTKTRSLDEIRAAYACGVRSFGENRIAELAERAEALAPEFAADPAQWHMIGHIQSRKARAVAESADLVHSLDSIKLATRLERFAAELGRTLPVLIEFNVSGEEAKAGFCGWSDSKLKDCVARLAELADMPHLDVRGLMTMAPIVPDAEQTRPYFRRLRMLRGILRGQLAFSQWKELSMGMTNDYQVAIQEGATMVRIGRAIFGERDYGRIG